MKDRLLYWTGFVLLLLAFLLGDAAVVVWSASLVSLGQLAAVAMAFGLIGTGLFVTIWQIRGRA